MRTGLGGPTPGISPGTMPTWLWILIAVVAVILLVLLLLFLTKGREKLHERKRSQADELRLEADRRLQQAGRREGVARQEAERAGEQQAEAERMQREAEARRARAQREEQEGRRERVEAEDAARRAEEIDPEAPDPGDDFDAREALRRERTESRPGGIDPHEEKDPDVIRAGDVEASDPERGRRVERDADDRPGATRV
jgi:hypothetical protein